VKGEKDMETLTLPLNEQEDYSVTITPAPKRQATYTFYQGKTEIKRITNKQPIELTSTTTVWKQIRDYVDPNSFLSNDGIKHRINNEILPILQNYYTTTVLANEQMEQDELRDKQVSLKAKIDDAEEKLKSLDNPLLWIGSIVEWLTAGERNNILFCFLAYCSQVILKNPISVIALGEAGSGKSHIEEVAMSLIPKEFIVNEKNITQAALFRRAEESEYFYDGKIVNYGDMGGSNDQDFMEESKNIMKELQSEGFVSKPVATKVDGAWETRELNLIGKPCLTYTTVPNYQFDEQELSRSIIITPRIDNKKEFNKRNRALEFHGKSYQYMEKMRRESEQIQYMIYLLRDLMNDTIIINPYVDVINDFLNNSEYYKRDFPKYNNLLKVISAFNYYNKTLYEKEDGTKILYTSAVDVQLFISLLAKYELSISENLSLHATAIINELMDLETRTPTGEDGQPTLDASANWTINDFMEHTKLNLTKRSIQNYFKELNSRGFIRIVERKGNAYVYELTGKFTADTVEEKFALSKRVKKTITYELGEDLLTILEEDKPIPNLSIMDHDDNVKRPYW
jgi:hypothetical protein